MTNETDSTDSNPPRGLAARFARHQFKGNPNIKVRFNHSAAQHRNGQPTSPPKRQAVIVCHGMGQQVPYETLSGAADLLYLAGTAKDPATVGFVKLNEETLPKATVAVKGTDGQKHEVDFFEVYWAPVTEGQVTATDTLKFLIDGAASGICQAFVPFERFVFGGFKQFEMPTSCFWSISGVFIALSIFILSLCNFVAFTGLSLLHSNDTSTNLKAAVCLGAGPAILTAIAAVLVVWFAGTFARMFAHESFDRDEQQFKHRPKPLPSWKGYAYLGALFMGFAFLDRLLIEAFPSLAQALHIADSGKLLWILLWVPTLAIFGIARWFLIEFAGDVAAYVSSYDLNKFTQVREEIQRRSAKVFSAVYSAKDGNVFVYDKVVVMGHSLGSVVAYDALNAEIFADDLDSESNHIPSRTQAFISFGSPLDKTAFLFKMQTDDAVIREGLAEAKQPLIVDYAYRTFPWTNIYSPFDIFAGALDYYDAPVDPQSNGHPTTYRVRNIVDEEANLPILAHVQYWENPLLAKTLSDALTIHPPGPMGPPAISSNGTKPHGTHAEPVLEHQDS